MKLIKFRVTNFRSVEDSGWIETDNVTALIGTNESGKTNILLPLWKMNPAKEGGIIPTADYPRKHYNEFRNQETKPVFIRAIFDIGDDLACKLSSKVSLPEEKLKRVEISRRFDSDIMVDFPEADPIRSIRKDHLLAILKIAEDEIIEIHPLKTEEDLKGQLISCLKTAQVIDPSVTELQKSHLEHILNNLEGVNLSQAPKSSSVVPRYHKVCDDIRELINKVSLIHPRDVVDAVDLIRKELPKFVYYSTYGNLDSEIYLPHVISNMERNDLGQKEIAKVRTLKVLFEFVKLQPQEILELGRDFKDQNRQPTDQEIEIISKKKKERSILLQSASTLLTTEFREWWKLGEYRFRFEADGDHFRIWVSDDKRPEEIELEGRSSGLQWFLSFYLVFLVERADSHADAILLLDEPGLSG